MAEPIAFSKTQRIVLLIDLNPLFSLQQNPNPYLTSILTFSKLLLSLHSLSSSLFAFKLFISSLSPLRSSSLLPRSHSSSLSFNHPSETLNSLSTTLTSLSFPTQFANSLPHASCIASSLLQLIHDYSWESEIENLSGKNNDFPVIRSHLVILLSPICRSFKYLSELMGIDLNDESSNEFIVKFRELFGAVNDAYVSRDIHCSWIDVNYEMGCTEENGGINEPGTQIAVLFQNGIRSLGWSFGSTESIVLGSALIPFGLIYPKIGTPFNVAKGNNLNKSISAQLSLEISDVSGKPLECKCCDLQLLNPMLSRLTSDNTVNALSFKDSETEGSDNNESFWGHLGDGPVKLHVNAVQRYAMSEKIEGCSVGHILVRGCSGQPGKSRKKCSEEFFADRALKMLSSEMGEFIQRNSIPIWQILLSFLYMEGYWALGYWALVSLSNSKGDRFSGILKPLTAHLALLSIIDNGLFTVNNFIGLNLANIDVEIYKTSVDKTNSDSCTGSQTDTSPSGNCVQLGDGKRKKNKKHLHQNLTWSSFREAAFECFDFDLTEIYFGRELDNSKKLKFLKCWMKQVKKPSRYRLTAPHGSKSLEHMAKEIDERLNMAQEESEQPTSPHVSSEPCGMQEGAASVSCLEAAESFFNNLPMKIQQSLESGLDLQTLAERLVNSTIHWLSQQHEIDNKVEGQTTMVKLGDTYSKVVGAKLVKLLLREPKELKEKRNDNLPSFEASDPSTRSENMILRSEIAERIKESTKQELVKQICSLLEIIQYLVEGGFDGHVSLYNYVERTIKTRYSHILEDVVHSIYAEMDLLLFADEIEPPILLFNSEDSNQSWREKPERDETAETNKIHQSVSAEDESSQPPEAIDESPQGVRREEHARKLNEARERRERARRFTSFTRWVPDLQRVWAPKQPKAVKLKSESIQKETKRKERRKASYSIVLETPVTGKRRSCSRENSLEDEEQLHRGNNSSTSVSKALFQGE
ncbi:unnamed protein product [Ilex paraguariensis]|uniref:Treslin N-terminal domain-containing protein n=1 Tax=Ilex paraguariensis TaxID=185542 RepID=A0ABC8UVK2_9AQUA